MTTMMQAFQAAIDRYNHSQCEEEAYLFQDYRGLWQIGYIVDGIPF